VGNNRKNKATERGRYFRGMLWRMQAEGRNEIRGAKGLMLSTWRLKHNRSSKASKKKELKSFRIGLVTRAKE